jgi:hypothetical protein
MNTVSITVTGDLDKMPPQLKALIGILGGVAAEGPAKKRTAADLADDDEDEAPKKKRKPAADDDFDNDVDDDADESAKKKSAPRKRKPAAEVEDDIDEAPKKKRKPVADDDDDEDEAPKKKSTGGKNILDELKNLAADKINEGKYDEVKTALKKFGAITVAKLDPEDYEAAKKALAKL